MAICLLLAATLACAALERAATATPSPVRASLTPSLSPSLTRSLTVTASASTTRSLTPPVPPSRTPTRPPPTKTRTATKDLSARPPTWTYTPNTQTAIAVWTLTALPKVMETALAPMRQLDHVDLYFHPAGTPVTRWHNIAIMPQAFAGEEFEPHVYAYIANATMAQARAFYDSRANFLRLTPPPRVQFTGTGDQALHSATYFSFVLSIVLASYDNDTEHVIVVIVRAP